MRETALSRVQSSVVAKIIEYVQRENFPAEHHLTETRLAEEIGVSRSPIRAALRALADKGVVISEVNRGFYLAKNASQLREADLAIPKPSDVSLYDRIALDRMRNLLTEQFTEAGFMRRYEVSRAQLVRILTRMAQDGLVQRSTGHGWLFLPVLNTEQAYSASYRFRMIIEPAGLLEPTFAAENEQMKQSREAHRYILAQAGTGRLTGREIFDTNAAFHLMLARFSGNRFIVQAIDQQNRLRRLSEYYLYEDLERVQTLCQEHSEIMNAISAGDMPWASTLLRRHLEIAGRIRMPFAQAQSDERAPRAPSQP